MNKQRRNEIQIIAQEISKIYDRISAVKSDEEMAYDNIPEGLLYSERAEESQEAIDLLDNVVDKLDEISDMLTEII